jgi:hypothetical protein
VIGISYEGKQLVEDSRKQRKDFPRCCRRQIKPLKDLQVWENKYISGISKGVEGTIKPRKVATFGF